MSIASITPQQLQKQVAAGETVELIDVRTPAEYREIHVACAKNLPLDQLDPKQLATARGAQSAPLYVICRSGGRAKQACEKLQHAGAANLVLVEGGTLAWEQAGLPVVRGEATMSLERQVRIAAGSLVLLGVVLALAVHPYFIGLSAFVGAGLVFAGITDTCAMGMLIARMPWNRVGSPAPNCAVQSPRQPA